MTAERQAWIIDGVRTPRGKGKPNGALHRFCGSGQTAVTLAAMGVMSGMQDVVVAGGVESMSRWPVEEGAPPTLDGYNPALRRRYETVPQGISADLIASVEGFTRQPCDRLAASSQERAARAIAEGRRARTGPPP
jgi:acetyl-CoA C-acetyltransferase